MPLPTSQVASAVKKRSAEARRDDYRDDEPPRRDKKSLAIIVGIFAAALVLVLLLFKLILGDFGPAGSNKSYPVPDVRGKTVEEAQLMDEVKDIFYIEMVGTRVTDSMSRVRSWSRTPPPARPARATWSFRSMWRKRRKRNI